MTVSLSQRRCRIISLIIKFLLMGLVNIEHLPAQWGRFNKNLHLNITPFFLRRHFVTEARASGFPTPRIENVCPQRNRPELSPRSRSQTDRSSHRRRKKEKTVDTCRSRFSKVQLGPNAESGMPICKNEGA